jgi:hypothetical protein
MARQNANQGFSTHICNTLLGDKDVTAGDALTYRATGTSEYTRQQETCAFGHVQGLTVNVDRKSVYIWTMDESREVEKIPVPADGSTAANRSCFQNRHTARARRAAAPALRSRPQPVPML